ncbi:MAG: hypothetical protein E7467_00790 [Ruminococcaceae bacterium]|nr:hypothetical protein [Oscillospiraceae bacterium]
MKHWIMFPDEGGFYLGMERELYEMIPEYRKFCRKAERALKLPLHDALFYQHEAYPQRLSERQGAVVVVSLANFELLRRLYPEAGELMLCGRGIGLLSALVAAQALSLSSAAGCLNGKKLSARQVRKPALPVYSLSKGELTEAGQIIEAVELALREKESWELPEDYPCLDIGPGRVCFDAQPRCEGKPCVIARLDEPGDPQYIWSGIHTKRLWSRDYCAKRMFGVLVATPNENENSDSKRLIEIEKEMRELLRPLYAQEPQSLSVESFERCVALLRENFTIKHTSAEEIRQRIAMLENETLISVSL